MASYYDPNTGQFLTPDPLDAITGERYGYADNNPINAGDPTGLSLARSMHYLADQVGQF